MKKLIASFLIATLALTGIVYAKSADGVKVISAKKAEYLQRNAQALFLDARGEKLYLKGTIQGAMYFNLKKYDKLKKFLPADKNVKLVAFCNGKKCHLSGELAAKLVKDGYTNVMNFQGGFPEWKEKGYTVTGKIKKCKEAPKGPYKPTKEATVNGVKTYLGQDKGMIDQFWFTELITQGKVPSNYQLVDVRKPEQFKEWHIKGAINIPQNTKTKTVDASKLPKDKIVVFYCNTGMMSVDTYVGLSDDDNKNVLYLEATLDCKKGKCTVKANEDL